MLKFKCKYCKGENFEFKTYAFSSGSYYYQICTTCRHSSGVLDIPGHIPIEQIERYIDAKV